MKAVLVCAMLLTMLTGCGSRGWLPYAREMGDTALLRTMGLDGSGERLELIVSTGSRSGGQELIETMPEYPYEGSVLKNSEFIIVRLG